MDDKQNFLDKEDSQILKDMLQMHNVNIEAYIRFWSYDEIQIDGDLSYIELKALVTAMDYMRQRHENMKL